MLITIIIASKNRPEQLRACLAAIEKSAYRNFEVVIVSQGNQLISQSTIKSLHLPHVTHLLCKRGGKSAALNVAIRVARGEVLAFTDDDCLVSKNWLARISLTLAKNKYGAVFGQTQPYQPTKNRGKICPAAHTLKTSRVISVPSYHAGNIGFGNNMAIKKSILVVIGGFKEWLGPGAIGSNAEDAEMALRILVGKHTIYYDPDMSISHNKWLTINQMRTLSLSYTCGEMACYGYFHFQKHSFATPIIAGNIIDSYNKIKNIIKKIIHFRWHDMRMIQTLNEIQYRGRGLLIGFIYSKIDPIR